MKVRIERLAGQISSAYRCSAHVSCIEQVSVLVNDPRCVYHIEQTAGLLIGKKVRKFRLDVGAAVHVEPT